jgi:peptide/nickel transport system substrate-binding protein/microcin C transport system substrate-binding protein
LLSTSIVPCLAGVLAGVLALCTPPAHAAAVATGTWEHGLAAYVAPKYPPGFTHFDYVFPDAPKGGVLKLPNPDRRSSFDKFNPFTVKGVAPAAMTMFVFESLAFTSMDEPNTFYGLIAEAMLVAPDLSSISFRIHPKARFSNGDPVTPEDVVHSFLQLSGKGASPAYQTNFAVVSKAVVVDARTVRFDLKERTIDALGNVAGLPVFSRKWGQVAGVSKPFNEIITEQPIASGPYTIDKIEMPRRVELVRNPDYWAKDLPVRRGFFNFDRIIYRMYKDDAVRREAFKAGEFDLIKEYRASAYARQHQGAKWRDGRIVKHTFQINTGSMLQAFDFNLRLPKFQDIRVREAIMRAWDFEAYNKYGTFVRANSMFNNTEFAAEGPPSPAELALLEPYRSELPPQVFGPAFRAPRNDTGPNALRDNLRRAQELLNEAGWKVAADGKLRNAAGEPLDITYLEPSQPGRNAEFQHNLLKLGITYTERLVDFALFSRRLEAFDFDMVVIVEGKFTLPSASDIESIYGSKGANQEGSNNFRGVKSRAVDDLVARIGKAETLDDLRTASRALDRVVMWNHWQVPQLFTRTEPSSYWNRFGMPKVQARYMSIDSYANAYSAPWPLWTWWDKALAPSQALVPAAAEK